MSKKTKGLILVAISWIVLGSLIFGGVMMALDWDFLKLGTVQYETNRYVPEEAVVDIKIQSKTADVILQPCEDAEISVVCREQSRAKHAVTVKNGVLEIRLVDERKWYDYIGINFDSPKITISIPRGQYGELSVHTSTGKVQIPEDFHFDSMDISVSTGKVTCAASSTGLLKIKSTTGSISLQELSADSLELSATTGSITAQGIRCTTGASLKISTGDIRLTDFRCKTLTAKGNTGSIHLKQVLVEALMSVEVDTGSVKFEGSDAGELQIKTDTGSVTGSLLSPKIFYAHTDTGSVSVPKTTTGGKCEITTDTGSIKITIAE